MSMTFTKLFSSITESTIWVEDNETRIVWITMLAMADRFGRVWGSIPGLANRARVPVEAVERALQKFREPDAYSRTKEHEGRRIKDIESGWLLLTYEKHRAIRDEEAIKESKRRYINRRRATERGGVENVELGRANAEAEAEADTEKKKTPGKRAITSVQVEIPKALDTEPFRNIWQEWQAYRKPLGGVKDWGKLWIRQLGELEKWGEAAAIKSLRDAMTQGWRGFFEPKVNGKPIQPRPARPEPTKFRDLPEADQKAWREAVLAHSQTLLHKPDLSDPAAVNDLLQDAAGTCRAFHRGDWVAHTRDLRAKMAGGAK